MSSQKEFSQIIRELLLFHAGLALEWLLKNLNATTCVSLELRPDHPIEIAAL